MASGSPSSQTTSRSTTIWRPCSPTHGQHASEGSCPTLQNLHWTSPHRHGSLFFCQRGRRCPFQATGACSGNVAFCVKVPSRSQVSVLHGGMLNSSPPSFPGVAAGMQSCSQQPASPSPGWRPARPVLAHSTDIGKYSSDEGKHSTDKCKQDIDEGKHITDEGLTQY